MIRNTVGAVLCCVFSVIGGPVVADEVRDEEHKPVTTTETQRPWRLTLGLGAHAPVGDVQDTLGGEPEIAPSVTVTRFLGEKTTVDFSADWLPLTIDDFGNAYALGLTVGIGARGGGEADLQPYADVALGTYLSDADGLRDDVDFGYNIGGGLDFALSDAVAVGPSARFHHSVGNEAELHLTTFQFQGNLSYRFR